MAYYQKNNPLRKSSPTKGKIDDFIKNIGSQLKRGQKERGIFSEKHKEYMKDKEAGESKYEYNIRKKRESLKAKKDKPVVKTPEQLQNINVEDVVDIETSSSKLYGVEEEGNEPSVDIFETFKGKPGDKFKYRRRSDKPGGEDFEFQRPGSDVWEQATDTDARTAINQLYTGDYEGKDLVISPIEKVSPYKKGIGKYTKKAKGKRGYKMKRK